MKHKILPLIGLSLLALTGCGGGDDTLTAASGNISLSQLQSGIGGSLLQFANAIATDQSGTPNTGLIATVNPPVAPGASVISIKSTPYDNCGKDVVRDDKDADSDSIPVNIKIKYACSDIQSSGWTYDLNGSTEVRDLDDSKPGVEGGYYYAYDLFQNGEFAGQPKPAQNGWKGFFSLKNTGSKLVFDTDFQFINNFYGDKYPVELVYRSTYSMVRTPDDMAHPFAKGRTSFAGFYQVKGKLGPGMANQDLGSVDFVFEIDAKDLVYNDDGSCGGNYYQSGSLSFEDGAGNVAKVVYSCGNPKYFFNGKEVSFTNPL